MKQELIKYLNNCYSEIDKTKCVCCVVTKDNKKYFGVNIKNSIYRDSIYAEVSAITSAISSGEDINNFKEIHIISNFNDLNLCKDIIKEFFKDNKKIYIYNLNNDNVKIINVKDI